MWTTLAVGMACTGPSASDGVDGEDTVEVDYGERGDCDPVMGDACWLPWPSDFYLEDDPTTVTGKRVAFAPESLPINAEGDAMTVSYFNQRDGFAISSGLLVDLGELQPDQFVHYTDPGQSLLPGSRTVLIDTSTGERVPHWAELDGRTPEGEVKPLLIRPAVSLDWGRTYVVGMTDLTRPDGSAVPAPEGFAALRDGTVTDNNDLERQRARFDEVIFPSLEDAGLAKQDVVLGWSFSTASRESTLGDLEGVVAAALGTIDDAGPAYEITDVELGDCKTGDVAKTIEGRMTVPVFTTADLPGSVYARDDNGALMQTGTSETGFLLRVPCSVAFGPDGKGPVAGSTPVLQYGHGLLGGRGEARTSYLNRMANEFGWVILAMDWKGFATGDIATVSFLLPNDPGQFATVAERSGQGMAEWVLAGRMMLGGMVDDPEFTFDGVKVLDGETLHYYGNSQGGIMGSAYVGVSPDLERGVLGVVGGPYSLLLPRSVDFDDYFDLFRAKYPVHRDVMTVVYGLTQQLWDPVEPGGWMHDLGEGTDKHVLMLNAIGDAQVATIGAHIMARAYGAKTIGPAARPIWGVEASAEPFVGSGLVEWRYNDVPEEPLDAIPPDKNWDTHECPRRMPEAWQQIRLFLETGEVKNFCDGVCEGLRRFPNPDDPSTDIGCRNKDGEEG